MNVEVTAIHGQSIWDLCLQYYGGVSAIIEIAKQNDGLSFAEDRLDYDSVQLPEIEAQEQNIVDYFNDRQRQITTY